MQKQEKAVQPTNTNLTLLDNKFSLSFLPKPGSGDSEDALKREIQNLLLVYFSFFLSFLVTQLLWTQ